MKACPTFLLFLFSVFFLSGCSIISSGEDSDDAENIGNKLIGKTWELRSVQENGYGVFVPEQDSMYTITFASDSTFGAYDICNNCGGSYHIDESNTITFDGFLCTLVGCSGIRNGIRFSSLLGGGSFPVSFEDNNFYITVNEKTDLVRKYVFNEYNSVKNVIMANPDNFDREEWPAGHFTDVLESEIYADSLYLKVGVSGCAPHELNLIFYNYFLESEPIRANAFVSHVDEDCLAYFVLEETFDLTPLKKEYKKFYESSGIIDINIIQREDYKVTLRYNF